MLGLALPGCFVQHVHRPSHETAHATDGPGQGPPDHAPAHGHRRKHGHHPGPDGVAYNADLGVYVVIDRPHHYWDGSTYIRWTGGRWEISVELESGWSVAAASQVPRGLRGKHKAAKGKHLRQHPAKHGR